MQKKEGKLLAKEKSAEIISEITSKKITDLASCQKDFPPSEYKQTEYFKHFDYIEGVGLDKDLSNTIFSTKKGTIIPEPFLLAKGIYVVQVIDLIPIDMKKYTEEKNTYKERLILQKKFIKRLLFRGETEKELSLKIYAPPSE